MLLQEHRYELKQYKRDGEYKKKKKKKEGEEEEAQQAGGSGRFSQRFSEPPAWLWGCKGASGPGHPVVAAPVQIRTENGRDLSALHIRFPVKQPPRLHLPALIFSVP